MSTTDLRHARTSADHVTAEREAWIDEHASPGLRNLRHNGADYLNRYVLERHLVDLDLRGRSVALLTSKRNVDARFDPSKSACRLAVRIANRYRDLTGIAVANDVAGPGRARPEDLVRIQWLRSEHIRPLQPDRLPTARRPLIGDVVDGGWILGEVILITGLVPTAGTKPVTVMVGAAASPLDDYSLGELEWARRLSIPEAKLTAYPPAKFVAQHDPRDRSHSELSRYRIQVSEVGLPIAVLERLRELGAPGWDASMTATLLDNGFSVDQIAQLQLADPDSYVGTATPQEIAATDALALLQLGASPSEAVRLSHGPREPRQKSPEVYAAISNRAISDPAYSWPSISDVYGWAPIVVADELLWRLQRGDENAWDDALAALEARRSTWNDEVAEDVLRPLRCPARDWQTILDAEWDRHYAPILSAADFTRVADMAALEVDRADTWAWAAGNAGRLNASSPVAFAETIAHVLIRGELEAPEVLRRLNAATTLTPQTFEQHQGA